MSPEFPEGLPRECPARVVVCGMFDTFLQELRKFESQLAQNRYQQAKKRRSHDLKHVYDDCRAPGAPQVDTIIHRVVGQVASVCQDDLSVTFEDPVDFDDTKPVVVKGQFHEIIAHGGDQTWLHDVSSLQVGDVLVQEKVLAAEEDIAEAFVKVWQPRWQKQCHVAEGQWTQIQDFIVRRFRPIEWTFPDWSEDSFAQVVRSKKAKSAVGPDGVSRQDLLSLPRAGRKCFVDLYRSIEAGQTWPLQLTNGVVTSLSKGSAHDGVDAYRPVTVFPLPYRVWSSGRARQALKSLVHHLPHGIQGGVPGGQAKTLWHSLAQMLERAHWTSESLNGIILDIRKAFNALPRLPIWTCLARLGMPDGILRAWASFVAQQVRRFRVRQSHSSPVQSNVGYPEGCGLSVLAMIITDWMLHEWLQEVNSGCGLWAYVDDWTCTFRSPLDFEGVWAAVSRFVKLLDLEIDLAKSCAWSANSKDRTQIRGHEVGVALKIRMLGAHQNFCLRRGNVTVTARVKSMDAVWKRLKRSLSPYRFKLTSLLVLAWPRALHGISVVHLGPAWFRTLRSGAMKGLRANKKGSNPCLHLACHATLADPQAYALVQTVKDAREFGGTEAMETLLGLLANQGHGLPFNGPTTVLAERLRSLTWQVHGSGMVRDRFGLFSVFHCSFEEFWFRFRLDWPHVMWDIVRHRSSFDGCHNADLVELQSALKQFGAMDQVFLRCHLDGTLYTQNGRAHFQHDTTNQCPFCTEVDGFYHRAWQCPFFAACRENVSGEVLAAIPNLPACLSCHGWPLVQPEFVTVVQSLVDLTLPELPPLPHHLAQAGRLDMFVDGTCSNPDDTRLRLAAWVVNVTGGASAPWEHEVLMGGLVPGVVQTSFRAELVAMTQAIEFASEYGLKVRVWSDCLAVVRGVQKLLRGGKIGINQPHSDLWRQIQDRLRDCEGEQIQVVKVVSHADQQKVGDEVESWAFWRNELADSAASSINEKRGGSFWQKWKRAQEALAFHELCTEQSWKFICGQAS